MPLFRDDTTNVVTDYPVEIGEHPFFGAHLHPYSPDDESEDAEEFEEDKVVDETAHSTQRVQRTATPKSKD